MQIHGIPVNLKLNSTVLMIASFIISVLAGLILNLAGAGRGVYTMLYSVGMAYLKLLFLLALPIVFLNLVSGVMQRLQLRSDGSSPARLWFFHSIAVTGAAVLGLAAGGIAGSAQIPAAFAGFSDFGLRWFRPLVPWAMLLSVLTGAAAAKIGPEGEEARRLFRSLADVFGYAGTLLLRLLPLGLFFLLCPMIGIRGLAVLWPGVKLVLVTAFCCAAYGTLVYGYQLRHCGKDCPAHFLRNFKPVLLQAFTACSSGSGEGEALHSLQRMGIAGEAGRTAWRCGKLLGKTGTVLYLGIACMLAVRYVGMPVSVLPGVGFFIWVLLFSLAGMKHRGSGLYCVLVLLFMLGLPLRAAVPLLMFEWLLDGCRSALNSVAAGTGTYLADKLGWMK
ncbi:cation:dicarboxylate symporter family transporter [Succiniclasticum ruminis]|uniref:Na+/H+-dicarboxylate symporter n=1 Tax=Succiniclasticum ruminis DSM 9236 TaxID=1123323 RepID=A0A1I1XHE6_9FIRM|nr:cation:dicarboxylase symporter family transporter [Succiniclasticum ruminis]SFE06785.1 Na+/H+-dicarboxylate symporter [Succiniclasticum ruminis DSM 9236]